MDNDLEFLKRVICCLYKYNGTDITGMTIKQSKINYTSDHPDPYPTHRYVIGFKYRGEAMELEQDDIVEMLDNKMEAAYKYFTGKEPEYG